MSNPTSLLPFLSYLSALHDPRQSAKSLYLLAEILTLLFFATISGADDVVEINLWGSERHGFLRRFLAYVNGIPSHATLCDVIAAIDPVLFKACFMAWVDELRDDIPNTIAIDGKTSRRGHARSKGRA